jgi:hypothetical protein
MKGINYLTNDKGKKVAIQIDLNKHDKAVDEFLMDLEDILDAENILKEERVPYELVRKKLIDSGKIKK